LIDQKSFYVGLSRGKETTVLYTDDRTKLVRAIAERSGAKQVAIVEWTTPALPMIAANCTEKHVKMAKLSDSYDAVT
jgi:hypothetical protein